MDKVHLKVQETKKLQKWVYFIILAVMIIPIIIKAYSDLFVSPSNLPINPIYWNDLLGLLFFSPIAVTLVFYYLDGWFALRKSDMSFLDFAKNSGRFYLRNGEVLSFNFENIQYVSPSTWGYTFKINNRLFKVSKVNMMLPDFLQLLKSHNVKTKGFKPRDYENFKTDNSLFSRLIKEEIKNEIEKNMPR